MSSSITLSSAISANLLALQNTQTLTDTTQAHLSTGQKVASAIDDPVAYFQSKALTDRANDFQTNKDNIGQGISSLSTALQGITSIQTLVSQLKGIALSAQSATTAQIGSLVTQYNSLRSQIDTLAQDTSYQGLNLIGGTGQLLSVNFSNLTGSNLTVNSLDATTDAQGLNIAQAHTSNGGFQLAYDSVTSGTVGYGKAVVVTYAATAALTSGTYTFSYGTQNLTVLVSSAGGFSGGGLTTTANFAPGTNYTLLVGSNSATAGINSSLNIASQGANNVFQGAVTGNSGGFFIGLAANTGAVVSTANPGGYQISITVDGLTGNTLLSGDYTFNYGGYSVGFVVSSAGGLSGAADAGTIYHNGDTITLTLQSGGFATHTAAIVSTGTGLAYLTGAFSGTSIIVSGYEMAGGTQNYVYASMSGTTGAAVGAIAGQTFLDSNLIGAVNSLVNGLSNKLQELRSFASNLGTNVALLNTRLDFTSNYVNLLNSGAGKLTLADLNQEGANLLALQTRQQLGVQALSFAGQNEKSILQLFR